MVRSRFSKQIRFLYTSAPLPLSSFLPVMKLPCIAKQRGTESVGRCYELGDRKTGYKHGVTAVRINTTHQEGTPAQSIGSFPSDFPYEAPLVATQPLRRQDDDRTVNCLADLCPGECRQLVHCSCSKTRDEVDPRMHMARLESGVGVIIYRGS